MWARASLAMFAVLASPLDTHGLEFRDAAARIAGIDTLQSFMKDFNKRYAEPPRS